MVDIELLIKESLKNGEKTKLNVFRQLKSEIQKKKTEKNAKEYNESVEIQIIKKMIKSLDEASDEFKKAGRMDLYFENVEQSKILKELVPAEPTKDEIVKYLNENTIEQKTMKFVIDFIKQKFVCVDGKMASEIAKEYINK